MSKRMRVCGELKSMTEYIAEFTVEKKPFDFPNLMIHTHGELVRCRCCKYYDPMNDDEGMCMVPDDDGDYKRWMVDAVGYCHEGVRRSK